MKLILTISRIHTIAYILGWSEIRNNYGDLVMTRDCDVRYT